MQLSITGHHVAITDALRNYVEEKIQRVERHFDHVTNVHVVLSVEKLQQTAEATLHVSGGDIFADDTQEDMYAAIDGLVTKLDKAGGPAKEKMHQRSRGQRRPDISEVTQ